MARINFPNLFGSVLQFNVTQLMNILAEQEVEKQQYHSLLTQLKNGQVGLSQVEISQDGVRVLPTQPMAVPDISVLADEPPANVNFKKPKV